MVKIFARFQVYTIQEPMRCASQAQEVAAW